MATDSIQASIKSITGISRAVTTNVVENAQRWVVSSCPKSILKWAISETNPSVNGGDNDPQQVTLPVGTDSIISVRRDSYAAVEVAAEDRGFIDNSSSLKKATNIFPKYYIADANRVIVKPDPDATYKIYVMYIDYSKVDDDSDLRDVIIFKSASDEFAILSSSNLPSWDNAFLPSAPEAPNFSDGQISFPSSDVPVYSAPDKPMLDFADANFWISTEEDSEMLSSRVQAITSQISDYQSRLQDAVNNFNEKNTIYQGKLQEAIQESQNQLTSDSGEYSAKLQKYSAELSAYQQEVAYIVQNFSSDISKSQFYSQQSEKYYNWSLQKLNSYIQMNEKMINTQAQVASQQGRK